MTFDEFAENHFSLMRDQDKLRDDLTLDLKKIYRDASKDEAPVRTGALRDSVRVDPYGLIVDIHYAKYVHYGTSKQSANPFVSRALADNKQAQDRITIEERNVKSRLVR